ncbi:MAG: short-chain dehydrogenase [Bacteroidetes bacterium]|nr:short-chain dehydrogenase [Bacteroidota bacterium]
MTVEQIERFIGSEPAPYSKVFLKARTVEGIFIKAPDFSELKKKNFWRIVSISKMQEYQRSKDINLSRIFNGQEFVKLSAKV